MNRDYCWNCNIVPPSDDCAISPEEDLASSRAFIGRGQAPAPLRCVYEYVRRVSHRRYALFLAIARRSLRFKSPSGLIKKDRPREARSVFFARRGT